MTPLADAIKYNLKLAPIPKRTTKGTIVLKMNICSWKEYIKTKTLDKAICEILKTTKSSAADISNKYGYDRDRVNKRLYSLFKRGLVIKTHLQNGSIQWASTNINQEA